MAPHGRVRKPLALATGACDGARVIPDFDQCYRAVESKDARFDGWFFTAVRTTGIYCRPSCPARTPYPRNVEFFPTAAAAQRAGYRACKRCRPDASPGSPEWDPRGDVVARAMRLIADGVVDREGVSGLARRLAYSERQLHRLLVSELGAGPLALARAQRAQTARVLIETTDLRFADVAFASGFASIRQFNDTVREVFATTPSAMRTRGTAPAEAGSVTVRLAARRPFAGADLLAFLGPRAVTGVEVLEAGTYRRSLALPHGNAVLTLTPGPEGVTGGFRLDDLRDLTAAVARTRRLFDLDADPVAIDAALAHDSILRPLVRRRPGLRVPGHPDGFELVVRAVVGQQVSVAGARTILGRLVAKFGKPLDAPLDTITHVFPDAATMAALDAGELPMPRARATALRDVAAAFADGRIVVDPGVDRDELRNALLALPGIGPWTVEYVMMRAVGDPDAFLASDLGVRRALEARGLDGRPSSLDRTRRGLEPVARLRQRPSLGIGGRQTMTTRWSVYDGPEGPLLLAVDDDDHLVRLHFAHRGDQVEDGLGARRRAHSPIGPGSSIEYFAGTRTDVRPAAAAARHRVPGRGVAAAPPDPVRRDHLVRRAGRGGSVGRRRRVPWVRPTGRTRSRSSCRVIV